MVSDDTLKAVNIDSAAFRKAFEAHLEELNAGLEQRRGRYIGTLVLTIPLAALLFAAMFQWRYMLLDMIITALDRLHDSLGLSDVPALSQIMLMGMFWLALALWAWMGRRRGVNIFLIRLPLLGIVGFYILVFQLLPLAMHGMPGDAPALLPAPDDAAPATNTLNLVALMLLAAMAALYIGLHPIFKYRRHRMKLGEFEIPVSIKAGIFSRIFSFFGDFTYQKEGGISAYDFKPSGIVPDYDTYLSEDWLQGGYNGVKVEIAECTLLNDKEEALFHGLMVMLDVTETRLRLGKPFDGRTVVIGKNEESGTVRKGKGLDGLTSLPLPTPALKLEDKLEAFSTHPDEAAAVLQPELLEGFVRLQDTLQRSSLQVTHWDDQILNLLMDLRMKKDYPLAADKSAINGSIQCAFYGDKVLVTIPYDHDLFEPNSIFEKPLHREDIDIVLAMMQVVHRAVDAVRATR